MVQTQIQLTEDQMRALEELARRRNVSILDLIREGVDNLLRSVAVSGKAELKQRALAAAGRFRSGLGDLSKHHDDYLAEALDA